MADKKRSVGLVVVTEVPGLGKVAVLQMRGEIDPEKLPDGIDESFPGGCQVTAHGRILDRERGQDDLALIRQTLEELGPDVASMVRDHVDDLDVLTRRVTDLEEVTTYRLQLPWEFLQQVRLRPASGGLRLITAEEAKGIVELHAADKARGVPARVFNGMPAFYWVGKLTVMFPDEREAVQKALGVFSE